MPATNCKNCGTRLSCSCKVRTAKDGTSCCSHCVKDYNAKLDQQAASQPKG
jgi:hypothetical protein